MTGRRPFQAVFDSAAAALALAAAVPTVSYQYEVSYRTPWLPAALAGATFGGALLLALLLLLFGRRRGEPRRAFALGAVHWLQLATLTATTALAISVLAPFRTIQTAAILPEFAWIYLAVHAVLALAIVLRAGQSSPAGGGVLLLIVLSGLNGRVFSADFAVLFPLLASTLLHAIAECRARGAPLPWSTLQRAVLALLGCAIIGTAAAAEIDVSSAVLVRFAFFAGLMIAAGAVVREPRDAFRVFLALVASAVLTALFTALVAALTLPYATPRAIFNTRFALFNAHPNLHGPSHAVAAVLLLGLVWRVARGARPRAALAAPLLLVLGLLVQGGSKAALGAFGIGCALLLVFGGRGIQQRLRQLARSRALLAALGVTVVLAAALVPFLPRGMRDRLTLAGIRQTLEYRVDVWQATLRVIADHPWTGVGLENYGKAAEHLRTTTAQDERREPHPHNLYLAVAQAAGLPGAAALLLALAALYVQAHRAHRAASSHETRAALAIAMAAATVILLASLLDVGLGLGTFLPPPLLILAGCVAGLAANAPGAGTGALAAAAVAVPRQRGFAALAGAAAVLLLALVSARSALAAAAHFEGRLELRVGSVDRARVAFERARRLDPFNPVLQQSLVDIDRSAFATNPAARARNLQRALAGLERLAHLRSGSPDPYFQMCAVQRDLGRLDDAMASIRTSIELAPDMVTAAPYHVALGTLLWRGFGDLDGAFQAFKKALILDIGTVNAIDWIKRPRADGHDDQRVELAGAEPGEGPRGFSAEDVFASIRADYERQLAQGEAPNVLEWLKLFHMYFNAHDYAEAEEVLARIGSFPNYHLVTIAREMGDVRMRQQRYAEAKQLYLDGLAARPNLAMYFGIGEACLQLGELDQARAYLDASQRLKEDLVATADYYGKVFRSLAAIAERSGDPRGAARYERRALFFVTAPALRIAALARIAAHDVAVGDRAAALRTCEEGAELLARASIDLIEVGFDNAIQSLAVAAAKAAADPSAEGRARLTALADPARRHSLSPSLFALSGYLKFAGGDLDGAHVALERSRQINRQNRLVRLAAIDLLIAGGRGALAADLLAQLRETGMQTGYFARDSDRLTRRYREEERAGGITLATRIAVGDFLLLSGEFSEAERFYLQAARERPTDAALVARVGRAVALGRERHRAPAYFKQAAELDPENPYYALLMRGAGL